MVNLDPKDFSILYELFVNSRQSSTKISKKTNINKSVVKYRIKKLEKNGIIDTYCIIPDIQKIGYQLYRFYITLQFSSPGKEKEIISFLLDKKNSWRMESSQGKFDIILTFLIKHHEELIDIYEEIMKKYSQYIKQISISQSIEIFGFKPQQIIVKKSNKKKHTNQLNKTNEDVLNPVNKKLLYLLNKNAKIPTLEIAKKLQVSIPTVISHMKNLEEMGAIKQYSLIINNEKIGFKRFILCFTFSDYKKIDSIIHYFSLNSHVEEIHKTIGNYHLEILLHTNTLEHFHAIMHDFRKKYADEIKDCDYFIINKLHMTPNQSDFFK